MNYGSSFRGEDEVFPHLMKGSCIRCGRAGVDGEEESVENGKGTEEWRIMQGWLDEGFVVADLSIFFGREEKT